MSDCWAQYSALRDECQLIDINDATRARAKRRSATDRTHSVAKRPPHYDVTQGRRRHGTSVAADRLVAGAPSSPSIIARKQG